MNSMEARKYEIIQKIIATTDDSLLSRISKTLNEEDEIVGYEIGTHKPVFAKELIKKLKNIEAEMDNGKYITHEEMKQKFGVK